MSYGDNQFPCTFCGPDADKYHECLLHCSSAVDGKHIPDPQTMVIYQEHGIVSMSDDGRVLVDVDCAACGQSGCFSISLPELINDVQWT